ncbi:5-oxoprolinase subunit PxpA [Salegentibacter chungangensis]|uniref:5-oxoprolinase subunit PxpA n=1 Tax=Salegentibacter chungangensis TaxID=1335724 RepID=A0ABW3NTK6_9FLAO
MREIHINCDLGEGGEYDAGLMPLISACNIACGGHAGTLESMQHTVDLAMEYNVEIGAHPSYPDKENFGRSSLGISDEDLRLSIIAQVLSLKQITEAEGAKLSHVKPHGALYNDAAANENIAKTVLDALLEFEDDFALYAPPGSIISEMAEGKMRVVYEGFADRNYNENYSLVSRSETGAVITKKEEVFEHLFRMFSEEKIRCENGAEIPCKADTFCLHSDTPDSIEILNYLHQKFSENNIKIKNT